MSQTQGDYRQFSIYCIRPRHAVFICKSCPNYAHCIVYCTYSLYFGAPVKMYSFKGVKK